MAFHAPIAVRGIRFTAILVAAITLLPVPGRCASCSIGTEQCSRCTANRHEPPSPTKSEPAACCERHASESARTTAADDACNDAGVRHVCGCSLRPAHRTTPSIDKTSVAPELNAGLVLATISPIYLSATSSPAVALDLAALPPPIPHRILHCSWII
jgi:hypothetical protein